MVEAQDKIVGFDMGCHRSPYIAYYYVGSNKKVKEWYLGSNPDKWAMEVQQMLMNRR